MQRPILRRAETRKGSTGQRVVVLGVIDELVQEVGNEMVLLHPFLRFHHQTLRRLVCVYFTSAYEHRAEERGTRRGWGKLVK